MGCRHHLGVDVTYYGRLIEHSDKPWELDPCCAIDAAEDGPWALEDVGRMLGGLSRERIRQIQAVALSKIRDGLHADGWTDDEILDSLDAAEAARCKGQETRRDTEPRPKPERLPAQQIETRISPNGLALVAEICRGAPPEGYGIPEIARVGQIAYRYAAALIQNAIIDEMIVRVSRGRYGPPGAKPATTKRSGPGSTSAGVLEALRARGAATPQELASDIGISNKQTTNILRSLARSHKARRVEPRAWRGQRISEGWVGALWVAEGVSDGGQV